jgi:hypothetical protein
MKLVALSSRAEIVEEMDRPDSSQDRLYRTLTQFQLVNRIFSRYRSVLTRSVLQDMANDPSRSYRLADLGAGGCDIARWLIRRCRKRGLRLAISAVEHDPRVARYARAANAGYSEIQVVEADVLNGELWQGADYIFANHLLHHLSNEQCIELIRQIDHSGPRQYLLSDLIRSTWAYYGFRLAAPPFFRNSFVVQDGLASIRRGFTLPEVRALLCAAAPVHPVAICRHQPSRFVIRGGTSGDFRCEQLGRRHCGGNENGRRPVPALHCRPSLVTRPLP